MSNLFILEIDSTKANPLLGWLLYRGINAWFTIETIGGKRILFLDNQYRKEITKKLEETNDWSDYRIFRIEEI